MENKTRYNLSSQILKVIDDVGFQYIDKDENEGFIFNHIAMVANKTEKSNRMCYEFSSTIIPSNNYICVSEEVWNDYDEKGGKKSGRDNSRGGGKISLPPLNSRVKIVLDCY